MQIQVDKKQHIRHLILFAFNKGQKIAEAIKDICAVYGEGTVAWSTAKDWYTKFQKGNFDLDDTSRIGRPSMFDEDKLTEIVKENGRQTCREMANKMNTNPMTISRHLRSMGFSQKLGTSVPHHLTQKNKDERLVIVAQLLARHRATDCHKKRFLHRIVTGDEKWCLYTNFRQRKEWVGPDSTPKTRVKQDLHPKKIMICVWWDYEGLLHWEILPRNRTVDKNLYISQLQRVNEAIKQKRPYRKTKVILLHDNAPPHTAKCVKLVLQELDWEVLRHPPYSPDLAPTDFHLFRSISNQMMGITFNNEEDLKKWLNNFFEMKPKDFWSRGFDKLVDRWEQVFTNEGDYFSD